MKDRKAVVLVLWVCRLACGGLGGTLLRTPGSLAELRCSLGWQPHSSMNTGVCPAEQPGIQGPASPGTECRAQWRPGA